MILRFSKFRENFRLQSWESDSENCLDLNFAAPQAVYAVGPRLPFSKHNHIKIKIMIKGRSVDVSSDNSS